LIRSKKRRKTISLHIKEDGRIVIYTPYRTPKWEIEKFIQDKQSWIVEKNIRKRQKDKRGRKNISPRGEILVFRRMVSVRSEGI